jgi:hypothetical protein
MTFNQFKKQAKEMEIDIDLITNSLKYKYIDSSDGAEYYLNQMFDILEIKHAGFLLHTDGELDVFVTHQKTIDGQTYYLQTIFDYGVNQDGSFDTPEQIYNSLISLGQTADKLLKSFN